VQCVGEAFRTGRAHVDIDRVDEAEDIVHEAREDNLVGNAEGLRQFA
jgi:hypothetical protein